MFERSDPKNKGETCPETKLLGVCDRPSLIGSRNLADLSNPEPVYRTFCEL